MAGELEQVAETDEGRRLWRGIVALAARIAGQAKPAEDAVEVVRAQTAELGGIARINDSGVRILHSARALRKVAVGK